jgi:hypothetical protein
VAKAQAVLARQGVLDKPADCLAAGDAVEFGPLCNAPRTKLYRPIRTCDVPKAGSLSQTDSQLAAKAASNTTATPPYLGAQ